MTTDKERAEFEAWATAQRFINVKFGETGVLPTVAAIEMAWQASAERSANRIAELEGLLLTTLHEADCRLCKRFTSSGLCNSITVCENGNRFISAPFFLLYKINEVAFNG